METTLQDHDILIVEKISKRFGSFNYGDIVTIDVPKSVSEHTPIIKRIIGVEGDTVEIKDGSVFVNNSKIIQDYTNGTNTLEANPQYSKVEVQKGQVYVLGDNRLPNASLDSRTLGPVYIDEISGKALVRLFPIKNIGKLKR